MARDFKDTLNLPRTGFPMRANLAKREPERLAKWQERGLYDRIQEKNAGNTPYILHDGPPYANGDIHLGHAVNKILKDVVLRYKSMRGHPTPYVPGFDCHGLPIEQRILREIGDRIHEMKPLEIRKLCQETALKWVGVQSEQFKRLGILGEWDDPYITMTPEYEVGILSCLRDLVAAGVVKRGFKSVHWDPVYRTALAEAEIEYKPHTSDSIYVRFPILEAEKYSVLKGLQNPSLVIWTTTPWTIPANLGVCLEPSFDYVAIEHDGQTSIVAAGLAESFTTACGIENGQVRATFKPGELDRAECSHPIYSDRTSLVMMAEHVTLEQGTGCVHTAPGHGAEDFDIGRAYGLPVVVPVDDKGRFTSEFPEMAGDFVFDANPKIVELLREKGLLLASSKYEHEYPHSWRSKKPIIFRATEQWFFELDVGDIRRKALEAIDKDVQWIPNWGQDRIRGMVENRPDWCISRQRAWGVPIPALRSRKSGESFLDARVIDRFIERVAEKGTDCWFSDPVEVFLPEGFVYEPTGENNPEDFEKDNDILDVWFDSGSSHMACLEQDERLSSPADLYLEGSDQHRGWFQAALLTSIGARGRAPYRAVLTHGFLLDADGRAMSKSEENAISPQGVIKQMGADNLRLWVTSEDYRGDVRISPEILKRITETYRLIRNTLRFQISNLYDFDAAVHTVPPEDLDPLDKWALHKTRELLEAVTDAYEQYEFHKVYQLCNRFCAVTLSATYHDILKDRLYTLGADSPKRRSSQTALASILSVLNRMLAPILVFTSDETHAFSQNGEEYGERSIHEQAWPEPSEVPEFPEEAAEIDRLLKLRDDVNIRLDALRKEKAIGQSLDARITLTGSSGETEFQLARKYEADLPELFIVSQVALRNGELPDKELSAEAGRALGKRCPRCWRWVTELTEDSPEEEVCARCKEAT